MKRFLILLLIATTPALLHAQQPNNDMQQLKKQLDEMQTELRGMISQLQDSVSQLKQELNAAHDWSSKEFHMLPDSEWLKGMIPDSSELRSLYFNLPDKEFDIEMPKLPELPDLPNMQDMPKNFKYHYYYNHKDPEWLQMLPFYRFFHKSSYNYSTFNIES